LGPFAIVEYATQWLPSPSWKASKFTMPHSPFFQILGGRRSLLNVPRYFGMRNIFTNRAKSKLDNGTSNRISPFVASRRVLFHDFFFFSFLALCLPSFFFDAYFLQVI